MHLKTPRAQNSKNPLLKQIYLFLRLGSANNRHTSIVRHHSHPVTKRLEFWRFQKFTGKGKKLSTPDSHQSSKSWRTITIHNETDTKHRGPTKKLKMGSTTNHKKQKLGSTNLASVSWSHFFCPSSIPIAVARLFDTTTQTLPETVTAGLLNYKNNLEQSKNS